MVKNIVLDMGNVLLDYNPNVILQKVCDTQEEKDIIMQELFLGPEWKMGDRGMITNEQRFVTCKERVPEFMHEKLRACVEQWDICMVPVKGAQSFCKEMKEKGYGMYVLSNACNRFYSYFPPYYSLDFFNGVMVSSDVHLLKPEKQIYEYFLQTYQLQPQECIFIDDREENVIAAQKAGMKGWQFRDDFEKVMNYIYSSYETL